MARRGRVIKRKADENDNDMSRLFYATTARLMADLKTLENSANATLTSSQWKDCRHNTRSCEPSASVVSVALEKRISFYLGLAVSTLEAYPIRMKFCMSFD